MEGKRYYFLSDRMRNLKDFDLLKVLWFFNIHRSVCKSSCIETYVCMHRHDRVNSPDNFERNVRDLNPSLECLRFRFIFWPMKLCDFSIHWNVHDRFESIIQNNDSRRNVSVLARLKPIARVDSKFSGCLSLGYGIEWRENNVVS